MNEYMLELDLEEIRVSPFQPRKEFVTSELNELAESIKSVGLIQPPVVRAIGQGGKTLYYELIAGERRWRAAKLAGLKKITVLVRAWADSEAAKSTLIENIQRVDLNPIEMAEGLKRLVDVFQMTQEELAERVGKKRSTVANYLRLLTLPPHMRQAIVSGEISMGHAKAILSLDSLDLKEKLHALIVQQKLNVRDTERESQRLSKQNTKKPSLQKRKTIEIADLEEKLMQRFGTKIALEHHKDQSGYLKMRYHNLEDLDRLLGVLGVAEAINS